MNLKKTILLFLVTILFAYARSQDTISASSKKVLKAYPGKVLSKVSELDQKLAKKTAKLLHQMQRQESKMKSRLGRIDSSKAKEVFGDMALHYKQLEERMKNGAAGAQKYISSLDTMACSLKFLQQNPQLLSMSGGSDQKLEEAINKVESLEDQFQKTEDLKKFVKERRQYLMEKLGRMGFVKDLKKLNKRAFYYSQQLNEYRSILKDHKKAERTAVELLNSTKPFKQFMRENSMLASLFRMPGDANDPSTLPGIAGLQTRTQINNLVQQQIAAGGPGAQQQFSQNLQAAQTQLKQLKDKVMKAGGNNSDEEIPDFKVNHQKTKSFWKRIELGANIQSQKANGYFPVTSDIGLSLGYKLNDKSIIGLGSSYKLGWGQNIKHISITHEGVGFRSFGDWKIKGSFWLSGGYEMNYRSQFQNVEQLKDLSGWKQSGLVGLSKVVSLKTKFFKKTKLQLMFDFLSYQQVPVTQPVLFRIGYSLK